MSYLDFPRLHFAGKFLAAPSTVNNTPNNYVNGVPSDQTELYWNPNGNGIFNLVDCKITALAKPNGSLVTSSAGDPLIGQPVSASFSSAPPKLVDLDPMQQNVSEIWGLLLQVGSPTDRATGNVRGAYTEGPFTNIWVQAQGQSAPQSSASGSATYQSVLTNLAWQVPTSGFLYDLQAQSKDRLSIRMVVRAHNNAPPNYDFTEAGLQKLVAAGVPKDLVAKLQPMTVMFQNYGDGGQPKNPGIIPTADYVNWLLAKYLGPQVSQQWSKTILATAAMSYTPVTPYDFCYGQIFGTIGPCGPSEPTYITPCRILTRPTSTAFPPGPFFTPAQLDGTRLTLDLGNSLPTQMPGDPPDKTALGELAIGWLDGTTFKSIAKIDYMTLIPDRAGIVDITVSSDLASKIENQRLCLADVSKSPANQLLAENADGYYMLADQFVFRMNPGVASTNPPARGDTAQAAVHVTQYGKPLANAAVTMTMLTEEQAIQYTSNTLGTGGTRGVANLSIPQSALKFTQTATSDANGVAYFDLAASDPGDPRGAVDGQVYFLRYAFQTPPAPYVQGPDELVSVHVYQQVQAQQPVTWTNTISAILGQYGELYPIMSNIGLSDYDSVVRNHSMIATVLSRSMLDPLHMPVTRDLSESRRQLVLDWIAAGMPK